MINKLESRDLHIQNDFEPQDETWLQAGLEILQILEDSF